MTAKERNAKENLLVQEALDDFFSVYKTLTCTLLYNIYIIYIFAGENKVINSTIKWDIKPNVFMIKSIVVSEDIYI